MPTFQPIRLNREETMHTRYFVVVPEGVPLADVMTGDFFVNVRNSLRPHDMISAVAADGSFDAEFRVVSINRISGVIKFRLLRNAVIDAEKVQASDDIEDRYDVKHAGHGSYSVIEKATGNKVIEGLDKESAHAEKTRLETMRRAA